VGSAPSWHDPAVPDEDRLPEEERRPDGPAAVWPGPDLYTLRAVVELDLALDTDVTVDAAHAVVSELADRAFGRGWQRWYGEALAAEAVDDPSRLLDRDDLAERVLGRVRTGMREDDEAPDPPEEGYGWYAYPPGTSPGRQAFRRAVRRRRESVRTALLSPGRPRVAGRRSRG
jgi:hypothetical protein